MVVEILHVRECPNVVIVRERLEQALEAVDAVATIRESVVVTAEDAARLGMRGSPTVLIDGVDPFSDGRTAPSLSCRLFGDTGSTAGAPPIDGLVAALMGKDGT